MKITSVSVEHYSSVLGYVNCNDGETSVRVKLTDDESRQIFALTESIILERKAGIAAGIANMQPLALGAPEAEYDEA